MKLFNPDKEPRKDGVGFWAMLIGSIIGGIVAYLTFKGNIS